MPRSGADVGVAPLRNIAQLGGVAAPAADYAVGAEGALVFAARVEGEVAAGGGGGGGLGEGQGGEQQDDDRNGDQEEFMPPPPPIG